MQITALERTALGNGLRLVDWMPFIPFSYYPYITDPI